MSLNWMGVVMLGLVVAGVVGSLAFGANEIAAALTGVVAGALSPSPLKSPEEP